MVMLGTEGDLARRYELERRIRELQLRLDGKSPANLEIDPALALQLGSGVPKVDGLVLVSNNREISIRWNPSPIVNLKRYEVQIATNAAFTTDVETRFTGNTDFTWSESLRGTTYYFRVRARSLTEQTGLYSNVLNGTSGTVITAEIANLTVTIREIVPGFTQALFVRADSFTVTQDEFEPPTPTPPATFPKVEEILSFNITVDQGSTLMVWFRCNAPGNTGAPLTDLNLFWGYDHINMTQAASHPWFASGTWSQLQNLLLHVTDDYRFWWLAQYAIPNMDAGVFQVGLHGNVRYRGDPPSQTPSSIVVSDIHIMALEVKL